MNVPASRRPRGTAARERSYLERLAFHRGVIALGCMLLAVAALAVPVILRDSPAGPEPIAQVPPDQPERGLVYGGLVPAKRGTPCVGGYEVGDPKTCAHGPDPAPVGLDVKRPIAPIAPPAAVPPAPVREAAPAPSESEVARDEGSFIVEGPAGATTPALAPDATPDAAAFAMGPNGVVCDGDGRAGKRVQVVYAYEAGAENRYAEFLPSFRIWAAGVETIYNASAAETGGTRHVRFVTTPACEVDVAEVQLPAGALSTFNNTISALRGLGFNQTDRKYMIFGDADVYCGIGTFAGDERTGAANRSNGGPSYGRSDNGCWNSGVAAHELGHNLGAVNNSAPNSSKAGHCVDEFDLMCYADNSGNATQVVCSDRAGNQRLDCGHNDYYHTNPSPGSYLATHWNVADNEFLIDDGGGGGGGGPTPTPTPTRTTTTTTTRAPTTTTRAPTTTTRAPTPTTRPPTPTTGPPTPTPTPTPTVTPGPTTPTLRTTAVSTTTVRLAWDAAAAGSRYAVQLNGRTLGVVRVTAVRVVGLRPDTGYSARIALVTAGSAPVPYAGPVAFRTAPATMPTAGRWLTLMNSLTGGAADVFGARRADGTPVVLQRRHDGANQRWRLVNAGAGTFRLQSSATGKCLAVAGGVARTGAPLVQEACAAGSGTQRWRLAPTAYGFALTAADANLVVGVGGGRYYSRRALVLQRPSERRYQSWTAIA
jgi:hypothetical protein